MVPAEENERRPDSEPVLDHAVQPLLGLRSFRFSLVHVVDFGKCALLGNPDLVHPSEHVKVPGVERDDPLILRLAYPSPLGEKLGTWVNQYVNLPNCEEGKQNEHYTCGLSVTYWAWPHRAGRLLCSRRCPCAYRMAESRSAPI